MLTTNQKGAIAETAIAAAATKLGIRVLRPLDEGGRYDLVFDVAGALLKVQCKWAARKGGVIVLNICFRSRRSGIGRSSISD
jgi:PD-(D/E)XK endonuclease